MDNELQIEPVQSKKSPFGTFLSLGILVAIGVAFYYTLINNPCDLPISYSVGNIDSKFGISADEVKEIVDDAANRWNEPLRQIAYRYDPDSKLKINLVYDERQQKLDMVKAKIAEFDNQNDSIDDFRSKIEKLSTAYEQQLTAYNQKVVEWNSKGGAPPEIYAQLEREKSVLEKTRNDINKMAALLNSRIGENNDNIAEFNDQIEKDKNKIVTTGEYFTGGDKINIYTYGDKEELRLVLMHELGHALSFEHEDDPGSILYPVLQDQDLSNPQPSTEDLALVDKSCGLSGSPADIKTYIQRIRFKLTKLSR